jgi:hypothetical protein
MYIFIEFKHHDVKAGGFFNLKGQEKISHFKGLIFFNEGASKVEKLVLSQWKRISCKQSARWQQLSWLRASAFFFL